MVKTQCNHTEENKCREKKSGEELQWRHTKHSDLGWQHEHVNRVGPKWKEQGKTAKVKGEIKWKVTLWQLRSKGDWCSQVHSNVCLWSWRGCWNKWQVTSFSQKTDTNLLVEYTAIQSYIAMMEYQEFIDWILFEISHYLYIVNYMY